MNYTMITPHHNHDAGYISLCNLSLDNLPDTIEIEGYTLLKKGEFHASLMAVKHLVPLLHTDEAALEQLFLTFQQNHTLTNIELTNELRLVRRDKKVSVIIMVTMPEITELFETLRCRYRHRDIPTQPTHITLYTLQPEAGIGIFSDQELEKDSVAVSLPELDSISLSHRTV